MKYEEMSIEELDKELDKRDELRRKGEAYNREETKKIMEIRNTKIKEDQASEWGLTVDEYDAAKKEYSKPMELEKEIGATEILIKKVKNNPEKGKELGVSVEELDKKLKKGQEQLKEVNKTKKPLHFYLNQARRKALKANKNAQSAKAGVVEIGIKGTKPA